MFIRQVRPGTLLAIVVAGSLFCGLAQAAGDNVIISKAVSAHGLDLNNPADAQTLYRHLRWAAEDVCGRTTRVDLVPIADRSCFEKALGRAVRQANAPLVTQAYLLTHTLRDAATWGIELPAELAKR